MRERRRKEGRKGERNREEGRGRKGEEGQWYVCTSDTTCLSSVSFPLVKMEHRPCLTVGLRPALPGSGMTNWPCWLSPSFFLESASSTYKLLRNTNSQIVGHGPDVMHVISLWLNT